MTMTKIYNLIREIDLMQESILSMETQVNNKLDHECCTAYDTLEAAKSEMIELYYWVKGNEARL